MSKLKNKYAVMLGKQSAKKRREKLGKKDFNESMANLTKKRWAKLATE